LGLINIILVPVLLAACSLHLPRPDGALLLGASLRFTRSSLILPATSDYAATLSLCAVPLSSSAIPQASASRNRGNDYTSYMWRRACSKYDLTYRCCSTLYPTRPSTLIRTLESHMEPTRGTALSILTSIGSDMHECRLACRPLHMHHTHWSAGHSNNVRSRFAKHQG
jgi:hypothetical protein